MMLEIDALQFEEGINEGIRRERQRLKKEIENIINGIDIEKYNGEYCFQANSFRKELKSQLHALLEDRK